MSSPQLMTGEKTTNPSAIASQLTGPGRSAIAVIGITGDHAADVIDRYFRRATASPMLPGQIRYGTWLASDDRWDNDGASDHATSAKSGSAPRSAPRSGESIVVTPLADNHFEIHCHGGPAAINVILSDLRKSGVQVVPGALTVTAKPLLIQEAESVLIHCTTARNAAIAMDQVRGAMQDWATKSMESLDRASPHAAPEMDTSIASQARLMLSYAPLTTHLTEPFRIVLVGAPNVGKSSLTNAILGYDRSITMNTAGTTRDVLHAETAFDGTPIRISDTAGIRQVDNAAGHPDAEHNEIETEGIRRAIQEMETADLVIRIRDPDTDFAQVPGHIKSIDVMNKSDLLKASDKSAAPISAIPVSATTGDGVPGLISCITDQLVQHRPPPGAPAPVNTRQSDALQRISNAGDDGELIGGLSQLAGHSTDFAQLKP